MINSDICIRTNENWLWYFKMNLETFENADTQDDKSTNFQQLDGLYDGLRLARSWWLVQIYELKSMIVGIEHTP